MTLLVAEYLERVLLQVKEDLQPGCIQKPEMVPAGNIDSLCYRIHVCRNTTALHESSVKGCCRSSDRSISRVLSDGSHRDGHFSRNTIARVLQQPTRGVLIEVGALAAYLALLQLGFTMPAVLPQPR